MARATTWHTLCHTRVLHASCCCHTYWYTSIPYYSYVPYIIIPWLPLVTQPAATPRSLLNYIVVTLNVILALCLCFTWEICVLAPNLRVATCRDKSVGVRGRCGSGRGCGSGKRQRQCKQQHWDSCGRVRLKLGLRLMQRVPSDWPNPGLLFHLISGQAARRARRRRGSRNLKSQQAFVAWYLPASVSALPLSILLSPFLSCAWLCSV